VHHVVLSAQGLSKSYGHVHALSGLSLELRAGEILGLLGPNGAGKTTAIRILTTLLPASSGRFTVMGIPDSRPEEIRALIGVLPESNGFPQGVTGADFLAYMGRLYGQSRSRAETKAAELLSLLGLEHARGARVTTYSRGMKQRLMIARSLINDPRLLFLDEPTLGLDPGGQQEMLQRIREAADIKRVAVILSSHTLDVVEATCQRVLILTRGRVIAQGSVADITRRVAVPHTCRIQVAAEAASRALSVLAAMPGVTAERHASRLDELIVSFQAARDDGDMNAVLERLIQAGVTIQAFSRESARLSDAFLSMIAKTQP
jgi:ABC-2 type transport system ATP-binding protein